ncbi:MAG: hypothetical protein WCJ62_01925 [Flavobacterium sp.]
MNKKRSGISLFFGWAVLFAIVLQSVHTFNHLEKELTEKQCHHRYAKNITEFTHAHHNNDHCFMCEFTFSTSLNTDFFTFNVKNVQILVSKIQFHCKAISQSFRGSLFALRAPPIFMV